VGDKVYIDLYSAENQIYGYQFALNLEGLDFNSAHGENISESNIAADESTITLSSHSNEPYRSTKLISFALTANESGLVSEMISIGNQLRPEVYTGRELSVRPLEIDMIERDATFTLYQNVPNPFSNQTRISFDLPETSEAKLSLYDVTGQMLYSQKANYNAGKNEVIITKSDLRASGLILYKLETKDHVDTKHMILIE